MLKAWLSRGASHTLVFRALGLVLLLAAALKGYQLATAPLPATGLITSRWLLLGLTEFEIAFGLWLWAGLYPRQTRWAALAWFAALLVVNLGLIASGESSCSCFGPLQVMPWALALFHLLAIVTLWAVPVRTPANGGSSSQLRMLAVVVLCLATGIPGGLAMAHGPAGLPLLEVSRERIDLGTMPKGGSTEHAFSLRNPGTAPVEIASVDRSCECLDVCLAGAVVPPGGFVQGVLRIDLHDRQDFHGYLAVEIQGKTASGEPAFLIVVAASISGD